MVHRDEPDRPDGARAEERGAPPLPDDRGTSGRPGLDRRRVLDAAVEFLDEHGIGDLTMRRAHLGVEAMALYRYVPGRESLIDGVVETVMDEPRGPPGGHPRMAGPPCTGWPAASGGLPSRTPRSSR